MNKYDDGYRAYFSGVRYEDCPYTGEDRMCWQDGWSEASAAEPAWETLYENQMDI